MFRAPSVFAALIFVFVMGCGGNGPSALPDALAADAGADTSPGPDAGADADAAATADVALAECGNGVRETGEACDGPALGGASCASLGLGHLPVVAPGVTAAMGDAGTLACTDGCTFDVGRCDPPVRLIGSFADVPPQGGPVQFQLAYRWDPAVARYRSAWGEIAVITVGSGFVAPPVAWLAFLDPQAPLALGPGVTPAAFDDLQVAVPDGWNAFDQPCWSFDCAVALPPRPPLAQPRRVLPLRQETPDTFAPGFGWPLVAAKGPMRLVFAVVHAGVAMPQQASAALLDPAGAKDATSLAAVPGWYAAQSQAAGLAQPVALELVWSGVQVQLPPERVPVGYDACASADFADLLTPKVALLPGDVLVQIYWALDGTPCAPHMLVGSRSFVLFATPAYADGRLLAVSTAHELAHLFGASDKYTDNAKPGSDGKPHGCWYADGTSFQAIDLMCHRVATFQPDGSFAGFENPALDGLVMSPLTAREIGWTDLDGDGALEAEDACPGDLSCE